MEQKLAEYRARKAKDFSQKDNQNNQNQLDQADVQDSQIWSSNSNRQSIELGIIGRFFSRLDGINGILKVAFWFSLWMFFIKIEFGAVFFAVSLILILYFSMTNSRDKNDLSAYSVFNENFERLDGTFTAEQFDKSLRRGGGLT